MKWSALTAGTAFLAAAALAGCSKENKMDDKTAEAMKGWNIEAKAADTPAPTAGPLTKQKAQLIAKNREFALRSYLSCIINDVNDAKAAQGSDPVCVPDAVQANGKKTVCDPSSARRALAAKIVEDMDNCEQSTYDLSTIGAAPAAAAPQIAAPAPTTSAKAAPAPSGKL